MLGLDKLEPGEVLPQRQRKSGGSGTVLTGMPLASLVVCRSGDRLRLFNAPLLVLKGEGDPLMEIHYLAKMLLERRGPLQPSNVIDSSPAHRKWLRFAASCCYPK